MPSSARSILAIVGSSNAGGNTRKLCDSCLAGCGGGQVIDLSTISISAWDYEGRNVDDGFAGVAAAMVGATDIVFCTPVYWYAMSAQMKTFFDRLSDLITRRKAVGRALAGRRTWLLANGAEESLPEGFEVPFRRTSDYFDMVYSGAFYQPVTENGPSDEALQAARLFGERIAGLR